MNLTEKYKIHQLSPCLNENELEIVTFIENKLKGLKRLKKSDYPKSLFDDMPKSTFYINSDNKPIRFILEQDEKNNKLWVIHEDFWIVLQDKYLLEYVEIQDILRYMVFVHFKFKPLTPTTTRLM